MTRPASCRGPARPRREHRWVGAFALAAGLFVGTVAVAAPAYAAAGATGGGGAPAVAQQAQPTSTVPPAPSQPRSIPRPDSGQAPRDSGERGGSQQELLFYLLCGSLVVLALLIWRDSRRKLRARARTAAARADATAPADADGGASAPRARRTQQRDAADAADAIEGAEVHGARPVGASGRPPSSPSSGRVPGRSSSSGGGGR